ncbi:MAG: hypothetical protein Q8N84_01050 [bacterium]|nr:hypothetical protein [bacterium]
MTTTNQKGQAEPSYLLLLTIAILVILAVIAFVIAFPGLKSDWERVLRLLTECCF